MSRHAEKCELCGADPADGFATINGVRFCHGDGTGPTCYEQAGNPFVVLAARPAPPAVTHTGPQER